jgi:hypothetical protein
VSSSSSTFSPHSLTQHHNPPTRSFTDNVVWALGHEYTPDGGLYLRVWERKGGGLQSPGRQHHNATHTHTHTNPHTHTHTHNRGKFVLWDPHLHADNRQRTSTAALPQFVLVPSRRHDARLVASELGVPNQIFERVGQLGDIGGQNY